MATHSESIRPGVQMHIRATVIALFLALPPGMSAQTPLRNGIWTSAPQPLPVCRDSLAVVGDTTGLGLVGPTSLAFVLAPLPPKRIVGSTAEVRVLVNVVGGIDSVVITGIADSGYVRKMREVILAGDKYLPGHMNGCRRAAWTMRTVTFIR
ncbi:MAG: hypothetical protein U0974_12740 [Gemmatimonadales bacterium]|nr:hypothetical protein [Gemmatimonadales bacterium]MDZ4390584.1 hypothetical protein [Gemmatimonadales bacterium]